MIDLSELEALPESWDSYGGKPMTAEALKVAKTVAFVPTLAGGINVELYASNLEIYIEIAPDGKISVLVENAV